MKQLTNRQREVLDFIVAFQDRDGRFPTGPEIAKHFGFRDPSPAYQHLDALEAKGYLRIKRYGYGRPTSIQLTDRGVSAVLPSWPMLGSISAGPLTEVDQMQEHRISKLTDIVPQLQYGDFFLAVSGDSMVDAGINQGELVVVRPGEPVTENSICCVWVEGEGSTLKYVRSDADRITLIPANAQYQEQVYPLDHVRIQGVVIASLSVTPR
ncbi:MAG: repressor LexA [Bacteroidetes bacterium]|nr:repressor LexA [Bacteroidota bacterium]